MVIALSTNLTKEKQKVKNKRQLTLDEHFITRRDITI